MNKITIDDLRRMNGSEGLILQGCGGDLTEWVDGINEMLTDAGILHDGTKFDEKNVYTFHHGGLTNLLFPFTEDVQLDMGKLAMWRLQTHEQFDGAWLSEYVSLRLGGFQTETAENKEERQKPDCILLGENGNIFHLMGIASRTLKENGMRTEAKKMCDRITSSGSYDDALCIIGEYVNVTGMDDESEDEYYDENDEDETEGMNLE